MSKKATKSAEEKLTSRANSLANLKNGVTFAMNPSRINRNGRARTLAREMKEIGYTLYEINDGLLFYLAMTPDQLRKVIEDETSDAFAVTLQKLISTKMKIIKTNLYKL